MANWHDITSIREAWGDADQIEDDLLGELLEVARDAVVAYAPALPAFVPVDPEEGEDPVLEDIPTRYRLGQMVHVKNLWNASRVAASGDLGGETFEIQPRPLDWHVKQILRPLRGIPKVG